MNENDDSEYKNDWPANRLAAVGGAALLAALFVIWLAAKLVSG